MFYVAFSRSPRGTTKTLNNVDVADQIRRYFSIGLRSRKWYHAHFRWVLDTCACNAYCMYKSYFERRFPSGRRDDNGKKVPTPKHRDCLLRLITVTRPGCFRRSISSSTSSDISVASRRRLAAGNSVSPSSLVSAHHRSISCKSRLESKKGMTRSVSVCVLQVQIEDCVCL